MKLQTAILLWSQLLPAFNAPAPAPAPWVVTEYVYISTLVVPVNDLTRIDGTYKTVPSTFTQLETYTERGETQYEGYTTIVQGVYQSGSVTVVQVFVPTPILPSVRTGILPTSFSGPTNIYGLATSSAVPVTYSPAPICSQYSHSWRYSTDVFVSLPTGINTTLTPIQVGPTTSTYPGTTYYETLTTSIWKVVLNPTDVPSDVVSRASVSAAPSVINYCYTPSTYCYSVTASRTSDPPPCTTTFAYFATSTSDSNPEERALMVYILCVIIIPTMWVPLFFCLGLWESRSSFSNVMRGKACRTGVPYCWSALIICCLCAPRRRYKARSEEDQVALAIKWDMLTRWQRFKIWFAYGMWTWRYPVALLGPKPPKRYV